MSFRTAAPPGRPTGYPERPDVTPEDVDYDRRDDGYDYEDPPPQRPAVLISIGGAAAAVAVIGMVFLFPATDPVSADAGRFSVSPPGGPARIPTTTEEPKPTITEDAEDEPDERPPAPAPTLVISTTEVPVATLPPTASIPPSAQTTTPPDGGAPLDGDDPPDGGAPLDGDDPPLAGDPLATPSPPPRPAPTPLAD